MQVAAGSHQVAASHYKSLLAEHPDDWDILQSYLDTVALPGCTASPPHQVLHGLESLLASEPPSSQVQNLLSHGLDSAENEAFGAWATMLLIVQTETSSGKDCKLGMSFPVSGAAICCS